MQKVAQVSRFGQKPSIDENLIEMGIPPNPKNTGSKLNLSPKVSIANLSPK
jgi:hypothetical protein